MMTEEDRNKWDEENSQAFLDYGNVFVPEREEQMRAICRLIPESSGSPLFYDLCCGEGLLSEALLESFPGAHLVAFDGSTVMLESAIRRLSPRFEGRFQVCQFDLAAASWRSPVEKPLAVVSSLAVHHLDGMGKASLFADVYRMLAGGGVFVIADMVRPASPQGMNLAAEVYEEEVLRRSLAFTGNRMAYDEFVQSQWNFFRYPDDPMDLPSTLLEQLTWLTQAGFTGVDVFWMKAGHAVFGGYKGG